MMKYTRPGKCTPAFLLTAGAAATLLLSTALYYRQRRSARRDDDLPRGEPWDSFRQAAERIRTNGNSSRKSKIVMRNGDKLMLYGLYKQALAGDAPAAFHTDSWNVVVEQAKYDAWVSLRGMPRQEAASSYAQAVQELAQEGNVVEDSDGLGAPAVSVLAAVDNGGLDADADTTAMSSASVRLFQAVAETDLSAIQSALQQQSSDDNVINGVDAQGQTALHLAADKGAVDCLKLLLEKCANPNATDMDGISVLQTAVIADQSEIIALLLQHGADPDLADNDGDTPRSCAAEDGSDAVQALFRAIPVKEA